MSALKVRFMSDPKARRRSQAAAFGLAVVLTLALSGLLFPRQPAPHYTVTDLGVLPGSVFSRVNAVNNQGEAAGMVRGAARQAVVFQSGKVTVLGSLPGGNGSSANGINSQGEVTGYVNLPNGSHAFLYRRGQMTDLGTLPGYTCGVGTAINDRGEITGNVTKLGPAQGPAFIYRYGKMTSLGTLSGGLESKARSINASGQIVGECYSPSRRVRSAPFLYDSRRRTMTALPVPSPYLFGYAYHINDRGQVVGNVSASDGVCHAVLWNGSQMTELNPPIGFTSSIPEDLNDQEETVGYCFNENSPFQLFLQQHVGSDNALQRYLDRDTDRAFVYQSGRMQDLNTLISSDADWILENARAINDRGQIVGQGLHHGQERAFLLTPIR